MLSKASSKYLCQGLCWYNSCKHVDEEYKAVFNKSTGREEHNTHPNKDKTRQQ